MRTVFREIRSSRTICRIGFRLTKNPRLIRPIVSTVTIPNRSPQHNQREHSMIRGVGPYSTLITPQAGSLFHAAFHIATSLTLEPADFETGWFGQHGSLGKAHALFGDKLKPLMADLNERLAA